MRTKTLYHNIKTGDKAGDHREYKEEIVHECPCGKGKIIEKHEDTDKSRVHSIWFECTECEKRYELDISRGVYYWNAVLKTHRFPF